MYQAEAVLSAIHRREFRELRTISSKMKVAVLVWDLSGHCQFMLLTLDSRAGSTLLAAMFSAQQQPGWVQDPQGVHWLAKITSLKLCEQVLEKGEMSPKTLKQVKLLKVMNNSQGSSSELFPYEHGLTERKGWGHQTHTWSTWKVSPLFSTSHTFSVKECRIPGTKSAPAFGRCRQSRVTEAPYKGDTGKNK